MVLPPQSLRQKLWVPYTSGCGADTQVKQANGVAEYLLPCSVLSFSLNIKQMSSKLWIQFEYKGTRTKASN